MEEEMITIIAICDFCNKEIKDINKIFVIGIWRRSLENKDPLKINATYYKEICEECRSKIIGLEEKCQK